jgi:hypothetical protein
MKKNLDGFIVITCKDTQLSKCISIEEMDTVIVNSILAFYEHHKLYDVAIKEAC